MLFDATVPAFQNGLKSLSHQLNKAADWARDNGVDTQELIAARLAPDMYPLPAQIRSSCGLAVQALTRLGASGAPAFDDDASDFSGLQDQIASALAWLDGLDASAITDEDQHPVGFDLPNGMAFDMTAAAYVRGWALPQFYFHLVTAYAILRQAGVPLGKGDYVGYMMQYLRPGTMPTG